MLRKFTESDQKLGDLIDATAKEQAAKVAKEQAMQAYKDSLPYTVGTRIKNVYGGVHEITHVALFPVYTDHRSDAPARVVTYKVIYTVSKITNKGQASKRSQDAMQLQ